MSEEDVLRAKLESMDGKLDETKEELRRNSVNNSSAHKELYRRVADTERKVACIEYIDRGLWFVCGAAATIIIQRVF